MGAEHFGDDASLEVMGEHGGEEPLVSLEDVDYLVV
jgi:hypothetical protein